MLSTYLNVLCCMPQTAHHIKHTTPLAKKSDHSGELLSIFKAFNNSLETQPYYHFESTSDTPFSF